MKTANKKLAPACCNNCRFVYLQVDEKLQCRRRAPLPYNAQLFHLSELVRDIAWSARRAANIEEPKEDEDDDMGLNKEATEAFDYAVWPEIERDDWCGEWSRRKQKAPRSWKAIDHDQTNSTTD
jgi:hypothetical protein